jgi:chromosome segregation ATPase
MQLISLKNFKSYESQLINNLSPHINVIIGKNG